MLSKIKNDPHKLSIYSKVLKYCNHSSDQNCMINIYPIVERIKTYTILFWMNKLFYRLKSITKMRLALENGNKRYLEQSG